jgi:acetyltransferase-like isoleucine patch superfamily enzyme
MQHLRALRSIEGSLDWHAVIRVTRDSQLEIGRGSRVGRGSVIAAKPEGDRRSAIRIGSGSYILEYNNLRAEGAEITIGDHCLISQFVSLIASGHEYRDASRRIGDQGVPEKRGITIGNDVWIGATAVVLPGVSIADGAVVAGGAIVNRDVSAYTIVAGNPARPVGERRASEEPTGGATARVPHTTTEHR